PRWIKWIVEVQPALFVGFFVLHAEDSSLAGGVMEIPQALKGLEHGGWKINEPAASDLAKRNRLGLALAGVNLCRRLVPILLEVLEDALLPDQSRPGLQDVGKDSSQGVSKEGLLIRDGTGQREEKFLDVLTGGLLRREVL